ncbi:MAG: hypothetical protein KDC92_14820, partial [Bacteroidetes bacterium]|nr:hypothetical protein [Bacteroidota bacterium]
MKDNKLLAAFKTLTPKELGRFEKFVCSPYFNIHEGLVGLAQYIISKLQNGESVDFERETLFYVVFDGPFNDLKIRHLTSDLLKLLESFMAIEVVEQNPIKKDLLKLKSLRDRRLDKHFSHAVRLIQKNLSDKEIYDFSYYENRFKVENEINEFIGGHYVRKGENNIEKAANFFDKHYILNKLRFGCVKLNYEGVFHKDYELFLFDEIVQHLNKFDYSDDNLIMCYYQLYLAFSDFSKDGNFISFKSVFNELLLELDHEMGHELTALSCNYCIRRLNMGDSNYLKEIMYFYENGLSHGFLFNTLNELSPFDFKNMIVMSCSLKQFDWAQNLISNYVGHLPVTHQSDSLTFNTALIYWFKKDYSKVLRQIASIEFNDPFYALDAKTILLKIYFEEDEKDLLQSLCESFRIYLKRNRIISQVRKTEKNNLIKYAARL